MVIENVASTPFNLWFNIISIITTAIITAFLTYSFTKKHFMYQRWWDRINEVYLDLLELADNIKKSIDDVQAQQGGELAVNNLNRSFERFEKIILRGEPVLSQIQISKLKKCWMIIMESYARFSIQEVRDSFGGYQIKLQSTEESQTIFFEFHEALFSFRSIVLSSIRSELGLKPRGSHKVVTYLVSLFHKTNHKE